MKKLSFHFDMVNLILTKMLSLLVVLYLILGYIYEGLFFGSNMLPNRNFTYLIF